MDTSTPPRPQLSPVVTSYIPTVHGQMEGLALAQYVCIGQCHFSLFYSSRSFTYEYTHISTSQIKIQAISSTQKTPHTPSWSTPTTPSINPDSESPSNFSSGCSQNPRHIQSYCMYSLHPAPWLLCEIYPHCCMCL